MPTTYAHVNPASLAYNLSQLASRVGASCDVLAVVKANAYGHGAVETADALVQQGVSRLAVVSVDEAVTLRESGITADIVVLGPVFEDQIPETLAHRLTLVVSDHRSLSPLAHAAAARNVSLPIHVKIDTGMCRLGVLPEDASAMFDAARGWKSLRIEGLMTHLPDADGDATDFTERQLKTFRRTLEVLEQGGVKVPLVHAANSAAIMRFPHAHFSMVRPGIMLYGYHTLPDTVPVPVLEPVLSLRTAVAHVRTIRPGDTVSYNRTFVAKRKTRIAVLPVGYADGYSRRLSNRGAVLIRGRRAPIVGLVCMDMTMVDVTDIPGVQVGDEVTLIGRQGSEAIWADEIAAWAETIPYEVLCGIGTRVPRIYQITQAAPVPAGQVNAARKRP